MSEGNSSPKKLKVIITDDQKIFRAGIRKILEDCPDMALADEASDGRELLAKVRINRYDAILLDLIMPGMDGMEVMKQLKSEKCTIPVLVLSVNPENQYAIPALKAGASGYLAKSAAPEVLIDAIKKIVSGKTYITQAVADYLVANIYRNTDVPLHELLTDRELKILHRLASGTSVSDISREMSLNVKTVGVCRRRILHKMNMKTDSELARYAIQNRLIT
jgi:two-component system, NarL family, invasion response regulator UvrY